MKKTPPWLTYAIISAVILLFNLPNLHLQILVLDDYAQYSEVIHNLFKISRFGRSYVSPFFWYGLMEVFTVSPILSRLIITLVFMIPCACLFYDLLRREFNLSEHVLISIAILPAILPGISMLPTFVIGSYSTWGLLLFFVSLRFAWMYFEKEKILHLLIFGILYLLAIMVITNILVAIPILFLIITKRRTSFKSKSLVGAVILIVSGIEYYLMSTSASPAVAVNFHSSDVILNRIDQGVAWLLPFSLPHSPIITIIVTCLTLMLGYIYIQESRSESPRKNGLKQVLLTYGQNPRIMVYIFLILWISASLFPYLLSTYFSNRYLYVASFGTSALLVLFLEFLFTRLKIGPDYLWALLVPMLALSGIQKIKTVDHIYGRMESTMQKIKTHLQNVSFPENSQVVLIGNVQSLQTSGYWLWSSGALQFLLDRNDIEGLIDINVKPFENLFDVSQRRTYRAPMKGLDKERPTFVYHVADSSVIQLSHILNWIGDFPNGTGALYEIDKTSGQLIKVASNADLFELKQYIFAHKIPAHLILGYDSNMEQPLNRIAQNYRIQGFRGNQLTDEIKWIDIRHKLSQSSKNEVVSHLEGFFDGQDSVVIGEVDDVNLVMNASIDVDIRNWTCWHKDGVLDCYWDNKYGEHLTAQVEMEEGSFGLIICNFSKKPITQGESYLVEFSLWGPRDSPIQLILRDSETYKPLALEQLIICQDGWVNKNITFDITKSSFRGRLDFKVETSGEYSIDDVEVRKLADDFFLVANRAEMLLDSLLRKFGNYPKAKLDSIVIIRVDNLKDANNLMNEVRRTVVF